MSIHVVANGGTRTHKDAEGLFGVRVAVGLDDGHELRDCRVARWVGRKIGCCCIEMAMDQVKLVPGVEMEVQSDKVFNEVKVQSFIELVICVGWYQGECKPGVSFVHIFEDNGVDLEGALGISCMVVARCVNDIFHGIIKLPGVLTMLNLVPDGQPDNVVRGALVLLFKPGIRVEWCGDVL